MKLSDANPGNRQRDIPFIQTPTQEAGNAQSGTADFWWHINSVRVVGAFRVAI
jgi:hypothetical protein